MTTCDKGHTFCSEESGIWNSDKDKIICPECLLMSAKALKEALESVLHGPEEAWNKWASKRDRVLKQAKEAGL